MRVWIVRVLKLHWDGEPLRHQQTAKKDCCTLFWCFLHRIRIVPLRFVVCGMNMVLPKTAYQFLNLWKVKCCQAISLAKTKQSFAELLHVHAFFQRTNPYMPSMCLGNGFCHRHLMYTKYCMPHFGDCGLYRANSRP